MKRTLALLSGMMISLSWPVSARADDVASRPADERALSVAPGPRADESNGPERRLFFRIAPNRERRLPADLPDEEHVQWYRSVRKPVEAQAWLGVRLDPVPPVLKAHVKAARNAVMVGNVYESSPADDAGLKRYDLIVAADGEMLEDGLRSFPEYVRGKEPGDTIELTILREGEERTMTVQLAQPPSDWSGGRLKYPEEHAFVSGPNSPYSLRGKILRPGPNGTWELEDIGPVPDLNTLSEMFLRRDDGAEELRKVNKDGEVLHVERHDDGSITVRRHQSGEDPENAEVKEYEDTEALKKGDPEAYELLESAGVPGERRFRFRVFPHGERTPAPGEDDAPDLYREHLRDWLKDPERQEWTRKFFRGPFSDPRQLRDWTEQHLRSLSPDGSEESQDRVQDSDAARPPRFEQHAEGSITVHVYSDAGELSRTFESQGEFEQTAPELFERYEELGKAIR
jgi:hypothetical protein